jgi:hypothetical protein
MKLLLIGSALCLLSYGSFAFAEQLPSREGETLWVSVGQTAPVYGWRGSKCDEAPTFNAIRTRLPKTDLGTYSDGGTGTRPSVACSDGASVRVINFTGKKTGSNTLKFSGDFFVVTVTPPSATTAAGASSGTEPQTGTAAGD